jgi:hypothetical protein
MSGNTSSIAEDRVAWLAKASLPAAGSLLPALALLVGVVGLFAVVPAAANTGPKLTVEVPSAPMEGENTKVLVRPNQAAPSGGLTVMLTTGGTATEGEDFTLSPKTLTFAAGATSTQTVMLTTSEDNRYEPGGEMINIFAKGKEPNTGWKGSYGAGIGDDDPAPLTGLTGSTSTDGSAFSGVLKLNPAFDSATMTYTTTVSHRVTHMKLTPTGASATDTVKAAKVKVGKQGTTAAAVASGTASAAIALAVGTTAIDVIAEVAPKEGSTDRKTYTYTYTVTVTRPALTVALAATPNPVAEGSSVVVTATLTEALSKAVTIPLTVTRNTAESGDHGTLASVTIATGATSGTGTITTAQDEDTDDETFTVALGSLPSPVVAGTPVSVTVRIDDDDRRTADPPAGGGGGGGTPPTPPTTLTLHVAGATGANTPLELRAAPPPEEGGEPVTVTAVINAVAPAGGTRVMLDLSGTATAGAGGDFTLSGRTIEIAAGATSGTATMMVIDDDVDDDGETVVIAATGSNPVLTAAPLRLVIKDNDTAGVTVSKRALSVTEGGAATYTLVLDSQPLADVVVTTASGRSGKATVAPTRVTFTAGDWSRMKTITVTGVQEGNVRISHRASSTDGKYSGLSVGTVTVTVVRRTVPTRAWHARFGRTVTGQVLDAVKGRLAVPWQAGGRATLAGHALTPGSSEAAGEVASRPVTVRELLADSSFELAGEAAAGGRVELWGRGAYGRFDGLDGKTALDGEVAAGLVGADWAFGSGTAAGDWSAGLAMGHARGGGIYEEAVAAAVTGLYPYAGVAITDWLMAWAAGGYGLGAVMVKERDLTADLTLAMGAGGLRGTMVRPPADGSGLSLVVTGDGRYTQTSSGKARAATGDLAASAAATWLARAGIEGAWRFAVGDDGSWLTPAIEAGARFDGGDAEKGLGLELGGGVAFSDQASGLSADLQARMLIVHSATYFREWGASAALAYNPWPATDRGLALSLRQSWGVASTGGMAALLGPESLSGLALDAMPAGRLEGEIGYGIALFGGRVIGTPNLGIGLADDGARDYRIGWRLATPGASGFEISLDAARHEPAHAAAAQHGVMLQGTIR